MDTGLHSIKTASNKANHKAAEATGDFTRNKIADKILKPKPLMKIQEMLKQ